MRALKASNQIAPRFQFQKTITNPVFQSLFLHPGFIKTAAQVRCFHTVPGIFFFKISCPGIQRTAKTFFHKFRIAAGMIVMSMTTYGIVYVLHPNIQFAGIII